MEFNFFGLIIGVATFLIIGLFHPLVIKAEYYLGVGSWWLFLVGGIVGCAAYHPWRGGILFVLEHRRDIRAAQEG